MWLMGVDISSLKAGKAPYELPISNDTSKGNNSTQERGFYGKGSTAPACPGSISRGTCEQWNIVLGDWKAWLIESYNEDIASYDEEYATLAAYDVPKKLWPKKPTHPTWGRKAIQLQPPSLNFPHPPVPTTHPHRTAAPADVIVDLGGGTEDSEYEDFEDELDI